MKLNDSFRFFSSLLFLLGTFYAVPVVSADSLEPSKVKLLKTECDELELVHSCSKLAVYFERSKDNQNAIVYYRKVCTHKSSPQGSACYLLGVLLRGSKESKLLFRRACSLKDADGCTSLAETYARKNLFEKALPLYEKGCRLGDGRGCHRLGRYWVKKKKLKIALGFLKKACRYQYPSGCGYAGWLFEFKKKDLVKAEALYRQGCQLRSSVECARLGLFLLKKKQPEKALRLLDYSCKRGFRIACSAAKKYRKRQKKSK